MNSFSITYSLSLVLLARSMTWCFINDVDEDENWNVNFTIDAIFTSFISEINEVKNLMDQVKVQKFLNNLCSTAYII